MADRRILALHLPRFAADRAIRREPALVDTPLALWATDGPRRLITATNDRAGIVPGTPLADAQAIVPGLVTRPADPAGDAATLRALATWCLGFTPLAAPAPPDGLVLDITGCAHLWDGEGPMLAEIARRVRGLGFAVRAAIAGTAAGALVLARGADGAIVTANRQAAAVAALPVATLRLDPELAELAERLGLRRIGDLAAQARGPLARRLRPATLALLDEVLGRTRRPITPIRPTPPAEATLDCPEPILTAEAIAAGIERLTARLCDDLIGRGEGVRRLTLTCRCTDGTVQRIGIGTGLANRDAGHLTRLLAPRIERIDPGFGIERMVLAAEVEPLDARQGGLPGSAAAARREALARLLDRLRGRLGARAVVRLDPVPSHWPEQAVRPVDPLAPPCALPQGLPRPVRLARPPRRIDGMSLLPDGPPVRLGTMRVRRAEGPERILPVWWRAGPQEDARDYWRVETEDGRRL
ncbi:Y-family DNA polymerase, partial [Elioraea sp.]|uniref:Y-family DNA polymerase n=1 Tax=Elioraea sp. TaxID=2185103 RepID=UPI003F7079D0